MLLMDSVVLCHRVEETANRNDMTPSLERAWWHVCPMKTIVNIFSRESDEALPLQTPFVLAKYDEQQAPHLTAAVSLLYIYYCLRFTILVRI